MNYQRFLFWNVLGSVLWSALYLLLGYIFGATWVVARFWLTRTVILIGALVGFFVITYLLEWFILKQGKQMAEIFWSLFGSGQDTVKRWFIFFLMAGMGIAIIIVSGLVIASGGNLALDLSLGELLVSAREPGFVRAFSIVSFFASTLFVIGALCVICFWLWRARMRKYIVPLLVSLAGSTLMTFILKFAIHRSRPDFGAVSTFFFSYPSGHATAAVALYGFLVYILWHKIQSWQHRIHVLFLGGGVVAFIGFSRLYLGVHWLSDVVAGYLVGALWLFISIKLCQV